jgi:hypothetical protein
MEVVHVVLDPSEFSGASAVVIDKCWHLLTMFGMATLEHYLRDANGAAHELAFYGSTLGARVFWFSVPPACYSL